MTNGPGRPKGSGKYPKLFRIRLSEEQYEKMKILSELLGIDVSRIVRALIEHFISGFDITNF